MPSKYYNTMSKINVDENFKNSLLEKLKTEEQKVSENQTKVSKLVLLGIKVRKFLITVTTILGLLLGSGVVYAGIKQMPFLELLGVTFSEEYVEYIEPVANQVLENEDVRVTLESTVCDEGFTVLQFRINAKSDKYDYTDDNEIDVTCLSFNDPIIEEDGYQSLNLGGANYNVIVNGEEMWLRGASANGFEYISDTEAVFYQTWFFGEDKFENQTEFTLTLDEVVVGFGEEKVPLDGTFEVTVSKDRAKQNTKVFDGNNQLFSYKKSTNKIEKVLMTPMQNIVKISKLRKAMNANDLNLQDDDYIGMYSYIVYDQYGNNLSANTVITKEQVTYEDGEIDDAIPGECMFRDNFKNAEFLEYEYLIVEKNENVKSLCIEINEENEYYGITKKIAEVNIDLEKETVKAEEYDEIVGVEDNLKYYDYLQSQIEYINDGKDHEIAQGNTDFVLLYNGFEIEKKTGTQYLDYMDMTDENNKKYNTNYYNYKFGEYQGKSKGEFGTIEAYEGTSAVDNVSAIATSKKFDLIPREVVDIYDIPEKLKSPNMRTEQMLIKVDLDGDNKYEYIGIETGHYNTNVPQDEILTGVLECSTVITLYDENFEKIETLLTVNDDYADSNDQALYSQDIKFADIDNDGIIEIMIDFPVWEGVGVSIYKYNNGNVEGDLDLVISTCP